MRGRGPAKMLPIPDHNASRLTAGGSVRIDGIHSVDYAEDGLCSRIHAASRSAFAASRASANFDALNALSKVHSAGSMPRSEELLLVQLLLVKAVRRRLKAGRQWPGQLLLLPDQLP